jgi:hypothetical protein
VRLKLKSWGRALACLSLLASARSAFGEAKSHLDEAKDLFRHGVSLLDAGDTAHALEYFLRSRQILPSSRNTVNAALCLERLGRLDEALEMYEEVLARFAADLDDDDRKSLGPLVDRLRERVGYVEFSSKMQGLVVIDGRSRGTLPLRTALRVLPGVRHLRITRDGYRPLEQPIQVSPRQTLSVESELVPLAGTGALRVEAPADTVLDVFIDGRLVGSTPWEGTLASGAHVLWYDGGDLGSAPENIRVAEGKTSVVAVHARALGAPLRLWASPRSAQLFINEVLLGPGEWRGRLPLGQYRVRASEAGYVPEARALEVRSDAAPSDVRFMLIRDPKSPRWPQPSRWHLEVGARVAPLYAAALRSGAERACPGSCAGSRAAWGASTALVVRAAHASGFAVELAAGYGALHQDFSRAVFAPYSEGTATYALRQVSNEDGPLAEARGKLRRSLGRGFELSTAVGVGLLIARETTRVSGSAWTTGPLVPVLSSGEATQNEVSPFVSTAVGAVRRVGALSVEAALAASFFPVAGPRFSGPQIGVTPNCSASAARGAVGCSPDTNALVGERAHGAFWALSPEIGAAYAF